MNNDAYEEELFAIFFRCFPHIPESVITLKSSLKLNGIDSLDKANLALAIEENFHLTINDKEFAVIDTLGDVLNLIKMKTGS